jgi:thymidylate kinase
MDRQPALKLVRNLCETLQVEKVIYCHWKSNEALDRSACGENDLDLLVNRGDVQLFTEILYRLGFKETPSPSAYQLPGVLDYYGYDHEADRFVHVHAHYQLILGDDMTKNYRLAIEQPFLSSSVQGNLFRVPAVEFEFIVFVVRMVLKHCTWDAILSRQGNLPPSARREFEYLKARIDRERVHEILRTHLPYLTVGLFDHCIDSLEPGCSPWIKTQVARHLQKTLEADARRPEIADTWLKLGRRVIRIIRRRVLKQNMYKRIMAGGAVIALVGGDGTGKTTVVNDLHKWLAKDFGTIKVHMGKPAWSLTTLVTRGGLKLGRLVTMSAFQSSMPHIPNRNASRPHGHAWAFREICTARDRYHTYIKMRRFATNGGLVICDRYPLPQIKLMDGPLIELVTPAPQANGLIGWLMHREKSYYKSLMPPEVLIVLKVHPETAVQRAVQRKVDEESGEVRRRNLEIWEMDWGKTNAHVIDASQAPAKVLSEIKSIIWASL